MHTPPVVVFTLGLAAAACGPGPVAMTDGPAPASTSTGTPTVTDSATSELPTSTTSSTTTPVIPGTTTTSSPDPTTDTTDALDTSSTSTTTSSSSSSSTSTSTSSSSDTDGFCPAGTPQCADDKVMFCDGFGGFEHDEDGNERAILVIPCEYGCIDGSSCRSCEQALAEKPCPGGLPRVMVLLDAASAMLNLAGGAQQAPQGMGPWDQARAALAGDSSIFDLEIGGEKLEDRALLGLTVYGDDLPSEAKRVVQYGACHKFNFEWALDPSTSCELPGCADPYGGPPIVWTFHDGSILDPPNLTDSTISHMPKCSLDPKQPQACTGSGAFLHLGLALVRENLAAYKAVCPQAELPCTDQTQFLNILIVHEKYDSPDAKVQAHLQAMFADGITTHVLGFSPVVDPAELEKLADWGSGGQLGPHLAKNQDQLEMNLSSVLATLDPC